MKKLSVLSLVFIAMILLCACETSSTATPLEECIDAMVEENNNDACIQTDRETLIEEYIQSFSDQFDATDASYAQNELSYSQSKDGSIERIEFWYQYSLLPEGQFLTGYDTFKSIFQTMSSELREMNDVPEFIFSGEYLFLDDYAYKYFQDANDQISGQIIVWGLTEAFADVFATNQSFLLDKADDEDLIQQEFILVTNDHNVSIVINPADDTYSYDVYFTSELATTTASDVGILIEAAFNSISLTLES